jgi:hypothetical protein
MSFSHDLTLYLLAFSPSVRIRSHHPSAKTYQQQPRSYGKNNSAMAKTTTALGM